MINNIYPHIFNNEYLNISPKNLDNIMIFNDDEYEFFVMMSNQFDLCWNDFSSINIDSNP